MFDAKQLIEDAVAEAGHDDFGEDELGDGWREAMERLLDSLAAEGHLNGIGIEMVKTQTAAYLRDRLGIVKWRTDHPEVADEKITAPVVIVGQPRTGTTILYDLLAQDRGLRPPLTWETDFPVPPPQTATYDNDPRIAEAQAALEMADMLIPGFSAFHPMGARLAQECVRITASDFRSLIFPTQFRCPSYAEWLIDEADLAPAYRWHRWYLQHLQSGHAGERWLLKSPCHLWHLKQLMDEYPDAILIQTHRDPLRVISSVSALVAHLRRMASDETSVPEAAEEWAPYILEGLERSITARDTGVVPGNQVIDVQFADFLADPIATIGGIYRQLDRTFDAGTELRMRQFLATNPGDGGGSSGRYSFANMGLEAEPLRVKAAAYQARFGVPDEPLI